MDNDKCKVIDGEHVQPCSSLLEMTEGDKRSGKARGIYRWAFINMETGKPSRPIFGAVSSEQPKGLIFNWCPWCGADLREPNGFGVKSTEPERADNGNA